MQESPISATAYEILGVSPTASATELRRAYRRLLRETHPDTGGTAERFNAVQLAWERVGTPEQRASYDRMRGGAGTSETSGEPGARTWEASRTGTSRSDTRPKARAYGHPGGRSRERYLGMIREWVGRGVPLKDPYDPSLVRSAPREIRHALADALAEEATAHALATLGIGFTVWHDVEAGRTPDEKIDHVVLGPSGLFAVQSEDYGIPMRVRRGDLVATPDPATGQLPPTFGEQEPLHALAGRARGLARATKVKFSAAALVLPDDALDDPLTVTGKSHGITLVALRRSRLLPLLRDGLPGLPRAGGTDIFELRTRLQGGIRFA
jgi:curved DNA-binding protein CbpA